jgi:hypothetical protein
MLSRVANILSSMIAITLIACTSAHACPVDVVMVKGRVEHVPNNAKVRVPLIYARGVAGETAEATAEATVENGTFSIPVEFLTQSRRPVLDGLLEKCGRRPKIVIVTLLESGQVREYDRVSLDFFKDLKMTDATAYAPRADVVLDSLR